MSPGGQELPAPGQNSLHMACDTESTPIIDLIVDCEQALSALYRAFAARFPVHARFWTQLAEDEERHEGWAEGLRHHLETGLVAPLPSRDNPEVYREFLAFLEEKRRATDTLTFPEALAIARTAERTYIERNLLAVFDTDSPEVRRVLTHLAEETERHRNQINEMHHKYAPGK